MAGHQRDLLDAQTSLEQPAGCLVAQVVEVQVLDLQRAARPPERGADRARVVGEDAVAAGVVLALHADKTQCIESSQVEQRHPLVVAVLLAWILAVTNEHDPDRKSTRLNSSH